jgi:hypothetical protein
VTAERITQARSTSAAAGEPFRYLWFFVILFVMAVLVPLLLIAQVPDVGRSAAWWLTLLIMVYAGVRIAVVIARGVPALFDFFFLVFTYVFMGMAPTVQIRSGLLSTTTPGINVGLDLPTAIVVCVGIACYELGRLLHFLRSRRSMALHPVQPVELANRPVAGVSGARAILLLLVGVVFSVYFVSKVGVGSLFESRTQALAVRQTVWPDSATMSVFYALAIYPLLVGIGAIAQVRRSARRSLAGWYLAIIIVAMVLLLTIINPISSARYSLGTVLFALVVYFGALRSAFRTRITMAATILGLIFLFPIADAFRTPSVTIARVSFFGEYQSNPDYDAFWQIANSYSYVHDGLVQPGQQALGSLLFWVPRVLYPNKPIDTGILLAQYRGYSFTNLSAPLWAEFLVNGGIPVLIIGFILTGFFLRVLDRRLPFALRRAGYWAIGGAIFPVYMMILLRGSLLQATGAVAVALVCLFWVRQGSDPERAAPIRLDTPRRVPLRLPPSRIPRE